MDSGKQREGFASRLGFILVSAGCAVGIGNVWRFPTVTGQNGGGVFVLFYLLFLVLMGVPVLTMELAVGRAGHNSAVKAYKALEPKGTKWHLHGWVCMIGCARLMMNYTTVAGWMLDYFFKFLTGRFTGLTPDASAQVFSDALANPGEQVLWMVVITVLGFLVCQKGLQGGLERVTKVMMIILLAIMVILAINSILTEGSGEGLRFYLIPDLGRMQECGIANVIVAAMNQAFFTLSLGIGAMAIFGSYIGKGRALLGEAVNVAILDTFVAFTAGLIIFPACFAFGVEPASGPSLVFITLPIVFNAMPLGQLWGTLFFLFMSFAALSTVIAVFETIMAFSMDQWGVRREKACLVNGALIALLSIPCVLGFNVLSGVAIPGIGDIQSIEDFLVSNNILPLGGLFLVMFVTSKRGWGWKNFLAEADTGEGLRFPAWSYRYMKYVLPVGIVIIFVLGYAPIVSTWLGVS